MSQKSQGVDGAGPSHDRVEISVALAIVVFGAIVVYGSLLAGIAWAFDGPRAGFFPFYIGLAIIVSGLITLAQTFTRRSKTLFAEWRQLRQVLSVVVPASIYVLIIPWIGIYVASTLLIAVFMKRVGGYGWSLVAAVSIGVPLIMFVVFERWFLVPLPKGPLEEWLGY